MDQRGAFRAELTAQLGDPAASSRASQALNREAGSFEFVLEPIRSADERCDPHVEAGRSQLW
jgi:hypothetical protein